MLHFGSHEVFQPPIIHYVIVILSSSISVRLYHLYLSDVLEASVWPCIPENHFHIFWTISLHVSFSPGGKPHGELLCDESRAEGKAWAEPLRARRAHRPSSPRVAVTKQLTSCSLPLLELSEVTAALPCRFMNRSVARWMMLQLARKGSEPADERARQRKGAFSCKRHLWPWGLFWGVLFSSQLAAGGRRMRVLYSLSSYKQESFDYLAYFSCALQMCAHRTWAWLPVLRMLSTEEAILNKKRL